MTITVNWAAAALTALLTVLPWTGAATANALPTDYGQIEVQYREAVGSQNFLVDISNASQSTGYCNQYGSIRYVIGQTNQALFTLPNNGLAQQAVELQGCAVWTPHYHPRASEILYVTKGTLNMSFSEENEVSIGSAQFGNKTFDYVVGEKQSLIVPQGLMHHVYNPTCDSASITTFFDNRDPGIVSVTANLFRLDPTIVGATTGLGPLEVSEVIERVQSASVIAQDASCATACPPRSSAKIAACPPPSGLGSAEQAAAPAAG